MTSCECCDEPILHGEDCVVCADCGEEVHGGCAKIDGWHDTNEGSVCDSCWGKASRARAYALNPHETTEGGE